MHGQNVNQGSQETRLKKLAQLRKSPSRYGSTSPPLQTYYIYIYTKKMCVIKYTKLCMYVYLYNLYTCNDIIMIQLCTQYIQLDHLEIQLPKSQLDRSTSLAPHSSYAILIELGNSSATEPQGGSRLRSRRHLTVTRLMKRLYS
jgi:hypothetical protein